jgi:hypothetical protein
VVIIDGINQDNTMKLETVTVMREGVEIVINKSDLAKGEKPISKKEPEKEPEKKVKKNK